MYNKIARLFKNIFFDFLNKKLHNAINNSYNDNNKFVVILSLNDNFYVFNFSSLLSIYNQNDYNIV